MTFLLVKLWTVSGYVDEINDLLKDTCRARCLWLLYLSTNRKFPKSGLGRDKHVYQPYSHLLLKTLKIIILKEYLLQNRFWRQVRENGVGGGDGGGGL